jgi:hypothetical protein
MLKHFKFSPEDIKKDQKDIIDTLKTRHLNPRTAKPSFFSLIYPRLTQIDQINSAMDQILGEKIRLMYQEKIAFELIL